MNKYHSTNYEYWNYYYMFNITLVCWMHSSQLLQLIGHQLHLLGPLSESLVLLRDWLHRTQHSSPVRITYQYAYWGWCSIRIYFYRYLSNNNYLYWINPLASNIKLISHHSSEFLTASTDENLLNFNVEINSLVYKKGGESFNPEPQRTKYEANAALWSISIGKAFSFLILSTKFL